MRRRVGELWIALGVVHFVLTGVLRRDDLAAILRDGYFGAVGDDVHRQAAFWLFFFGVPMIFFGAALRWIGRRLGTMPESVCWLALAGSTLGALAVPASGAWLGMLLAVLGISAARQNPGTAARDVRERDRV